MSPGSRPVIPNLGDWSDHCARSRRKSVVGKHPNVRSGVSSHGNRSLGKALSDAALPDRASAHSPPSGLNSHRDALWRFSSMHCIRSAATVPGTLASHATHFRYNPHHYVHIERLDYRSETVVYREELLVIFTKNLIRRIIPAPEPLRFVGGIFLFRAGIGSRRRRGRRGSRWC